MDTDEFINRRAVRLPAKESVLFLFNLASGHNYNVTDITIGEAAPSGVNGETDVLVTGTAYKGLTGEGTAIGTARFTYLRPDLARLGIPTDGTFFDIFRDKPDFIGAMAEFTRRTGFTCTPDDFDEEAFYPDSSGIRRLKASPKSFRFIGEVALGRPHRDDISVLIPSLVRAGFRTYDGAFLNNVNRMQANLIITHRPDDYARCVVGTVFNRPSDPLIDFILTHLNRKGIPSQWSIFPVGNVNLYALKVTYRGSLREGDVPPLKDIDRVVALTLAPVEGLWMTGEIKLFFSTKGVRTPSFSVGNITTLNLTTPQVHNGALGTMLSAATVGKRLNQIGGARDVADLFSAATGLVYSPEIYGDLVVTYNGPSRPVDQLPIDVLSAMVVVFDHDIAMPATLSGPLKILYRTS